MTTTYSIETDDKETFKRVLELIDRDEHEQIRAGTAGDDGNTIPSDDLQAVYDAVERDPGRSRRIYHAALIDDDRVPYEDPDDDEGEREDVGEQMWDLKRMGYLRNEGNCWYTN